MNPGSGSGQPVANGHSGQRHGMPAAIWAAIPAGSAQVLLQNTLYTLYSLSVLDNCHSLSVLDNCLGGLWPMYRKGLHTWWPTPCAANTLSLLGHSQADGPPVIRSKALSVDTGQLAWCNTTLTHHLH